jgi:hypothetical protein
MKNSTQKFRFKFEKFIPSKDNVVNASRRSKIRKQKYFRLILGGLAGAVIGLLYWKFVGCSSGHCAITATPYRSTIMFSLMGALFARDKPGKRA